MNFKTFYPTTNTYPLPIDFGYGTSYWKFLRDVYISLKKDNWYGMRAKELAITLKNNFPTFSGVGRDFYAIIRLFCETYELESEEDTESEKEPIIFFYLKEEEEKTDGKD